MADPRNNSLPAQACFTLKVVIILEIILTMGGGGGGCSLLGRAAPIFFFIFFRQHGSVGVVALDKPPTKLC